MTDAVVIAETDSLETARLLYLRMAIVVALAEAIKDDPLERLFGARDRQSSYVCAADQVHRRRVLPIMLPPVFEPREQAFKHNIVAVRQPPPTQRAVRPSPINDRHGKTHRYGPKRGRS